MIGKYAEAPPGFEGTIRRMKRKREFQGPEGKSRAYAIAWAMKNKGDKSHYYESGKPKPEKRLEKTSNTSIPNPVYHWAMEYLPVDTNPEVMRRVLKERLRDAPKPAESSRTSQVLGQGLVGGLGGLALGGLGRLALGKKRGILAIPTALGALVGGGEALTARGKKRHQKYHEDEVASWKWARNPQNRKVLIEQIVRDASPGGWMEDLARPIEKQARVGGGQTFALPRLGLGARLKALLSRKPKGIPTPQVAGFSDELRKIREV